MAGGVAGQDDQRPGIGATQRATSNSAEATQRAATAVRKAPALSIPPEKIADIERSLSRYVGPLAKLLVKREQGEAASVEDFFRHLAENIPEGPEQNEFMK